ncbi:MAG TPA: DUF4430 domain-containing protein [Candidatus Lokiarchaeia archaeon]|nr:DUF4430 domain-containing protein [Candidatus Lokiarchaeia archaeon]
MNDQERSPRFKWKPTLVIFVISITALIAVNYSLPFFLNTGNPQISNKTTLANITVRVNYQNGTIQNKTNISSHVVNATAFNIMNESFQITYLPYPNGYLLTGINGDKPIQGWNYWVNGVLIPEAFNLFVVENDSLIEWKPA